MSSNLVIALHSSIFSGECFFAAGDYGGNVLVSTVFLFFFYRRKVGATGDRGEQQGFASYTSMCCLHHGTSCLKLQLLNIQLINIIKIRIWQQSHPPGSQITLKCIHICPGFSHCFLKGSCSFPILLYKTNNSFCQKNILFYYITTTTTHVNKLDSFSGTFK